MPRSCAPSWSLERAIRRRRDRRHFNQALHDFRLLLLERRDEIRHADPDHAVVACFNVVYASLGRYLGFGAMGSESELGNWDQLLEDVSLMALYFLLGDPRTVRPKSARPRSRP